MLIYSNLTRNKLKEQLAKDSSPLLEGKVAYGIKIDKKIIAMLFAASPDPTPDLKPTGSLDWVNFVSKPHLFVFEAMSPGFKIALRWNNKTVAYLAPEPYREILPLILGETPAGKSKQHTQLSLVNLAPDVVAAGDYSIA